MKTNLRKLWLLLITLLTGNIVASYAQVAKLPTKWTRASIESSLPLPEYPRPQLQRIDWLCLNGKWDYIGGVSAPASANPSKPVIFEGKVEQILVPYCPESVLSGIQRNQEINMWYRRAFEIPSNWKDKHIILHFDAVDHDATVFVNGKKVGTHAGGYDAFSLDITAFLKKGPNTLIVAAHDPNDGRTPSGKNGPRGDYTFSSGIWQTVWLEPVNANHIKDIRLLADLANARLKVLVNGAPGQVAAVALDGKKVVSQVKGETGRKTSTLGS